VRLCHAVHTSRLLCLTTHAFSLLDHPLPTRRSFDSRKRCTSLKQLLTSSRLLLAVQLAGMLQSPTQLQFLTPLQRSRKLLTLC
jgi:hypothetical protein